MSDKYKIASAWEDIPDSERQPLRTLICELVGYPCKLACIPNEGCIYIHIFNEDKQKVIDKLELQETGAIGVIFESYSLKNLPRAHALDAVCTVYNTKNNVVFEEESESESMTGSESTSMTGSEEIDKITILE